MSDEEAEREWKPDPAVTAAALAAIDARQARLPTCWLCDQRSLKFDEFGLCSKVSQPHKDARAEARRDARAVSRV